MISLHIYYDLLQELVSLVLRFGIVQSTFSYFPLLQMQLEHLNHCCHFLSSIRVATDSRHEAVAGQESGSHPCGSRSASPPPPHASPHF